MPKKSLLLLLAIYIGVTAITYGALAVIHGKGSNSGTDTSQNGSTSQTAANGQSALGKLLTIDPSEPKDQVCPLNGKKYTKTEADAWGKRRPLAVMIENHPDARPQSGLSRADIVFEAMAEGGVTRFMGLFYCDVQTDDVTLAPIRSARQYFFELASGFNRPMYVHVGGANTPGPADALGHIADAGWNGQNDMNQFSIGYPTFVRDYNRLGDNVTLATEHTMVTSTEKLWAVAAKRGWTNIAPSAAAIVTGPVRLSSATLASGSAAVQSGGDGAGESAPTTTGSKSKNIAGQDWKDGYTPWQFQDGTPKIGSINTISFAFWDGFDQYGVRWDYDPSSNMYKRTMAGQPHIDLNTKQQIQVANAVVIFAEEKGPIDAEKHLLYTLSGATGNALVFQNGTVVKAMWSKSSREGQLIFTEAGSGAPLKFVRGETWISMVSPSTKITY